jgi:hypothetical protein
MARHKPIEAASEATDRVEPGDFDELIKANVSIVSTPGIVPGVTVGTLVGFTENGSIPLVTYPGQPGAVALSARTTVDLHAPHVGREVILVFDSGDPGRPIVIGCVRDHSRHSASPPLPGRVEVEADGERMIVTAARGLVLRCGKASITLSPEGKIVLRGTDVVSHASGRNRIRGGSVQIN